MGGDRNLQRQKGANKLRLRPGVMLGSDDIRGVQQTFFEIVSNSIDRFKAGYGDKIIITRHKDNSFTVQDFADGLPMDWYEEEQAYNWELGLRVLYAGDNYEQSDSNDGILGYNGLGLTSTQFTSEYMNVTVYKNGIKYEVKCREGRPVDYQTDSFICDDTDELFNKENGALILKKSTVESHLTGTIINYKPDLKVFTDINIPIDWMRNKLKKQVVVNNGLEIVFNDELNEVEEVFKYDSLDQYIEELGQEKNLIDIVSFKGEGVGRDIKTKPEYQVSYEVSFTLNNEYSKCEYYHNSSELTELKDNATTKAIEKAFVSVVHNHLNSNGLYKAKEGKIKFADIEDSLLLVISSKSTQTSYANQTKLAIDNKFIREFVAEDVGDKLHLLMVENKDIAKQFMDRVLVNFRSRVKSDASRKALKKKLSEGIDSFTKVDGLVDCKKHGEEAELYITEGKSGLGCMVLARNPEFQAGIAIRGKILNCLKHSPEVVLKSDIVMNLIRIIGTGIETKKKKDLGEFDIANLRYGKIIFLCDEDPDARAIVALLLTMFYKLTPTLIKEGKIYIAQTPLHEIKDLKTKKIYYAQNDKEKEDIIKGLEKYSIARNKGIGEVEPSVLNDTAMNPVTRTIIQVTMNDFDNATKFFTKWMDNDVTERKEYIEQHLNEYIIED